MSLSVDVISDVICPWCFIGKRRLEKAIASVDAQVKVRWHPFQLNPTMPKEGISRRDYRIKKFGSWERSMPTSLPLAKKKASTLPSTRWSGHRTRWMPIG